MYNYGDWQSQICSVGQQAWAPGAPVVQCPCEGQQFGDPGVSVVQRMSEGSLLENSLLLRDSFRISTDWMRSTHIMVGHLLYSVFTNLSVNLIPKHPLNWHIKSTVTDVSELNNPIKRLRLPEWIKKQISIMCCLQETHFRLKYTNRFKVKRMEKYIMQTAAIKNLEWLYYETK